MALKLSMKRNVSLKRRALHKSAILVSKAIYFHNDIKIDLPINGGGSEPMVIPVIF